MKLIILKSGIKGMKWGQLKFAGKRNSRDTDHFRNALKKVAEKYGKTPISDKQVTDVYREYIRNKFEDNSDDIMPPHRIKMFKKGDIKLVVLAKAQKGTHEEMRQYKTKTGKLAQRRMRVGEKEDGGLTGAKNAQRIGRLKRYISGMKREINILSRGGAIYPFPKQSEHINKKWIKQRENRIANTEKKIKKLGGDIKGKPTALTGDEKHVLRSERITNKIIVQKLLPLFVKNNIYNPEEFFNPFSGTKTSKERIKRRKAMGRKINKVKKTIASDLKSAEELLNGKNIKTSAGNYHYDGKSFSHSDGSVLKIPLAEFIVDYMDKEAASDFTYLEIDEFVNQYSE